MNKVLVKFSASWCQPCKDLQSTIDNLGDELQVDEIQYIDIDVDTNAAKEYGIRGIPTLILFEEGEEIKRTSGNLSAAALKMFVGD